MLVMLGVLPSGLSGGQSGEGRGATHALTEGEADGGAGSLCCPRLLGTSGFSQVH